MASETGGEGGPRRRKRRRRRSKPAADPPVGAPSAEPAATPAAKGSSPGSPRRRRTTRSRKPRTTPTLHEVSAGGVVYRRNGDEIEVLLASRRTRRGDLAWGLAKGGIEDGESIEDAAVREVREETGIEARIESPLGDTKYMYVWENVRIRKTVHFFLMRETGGDVGDRDDEMEEIRWFPLPRALKRAAYRGEREVLRRAADALG